MVDKLNWPPHRNAPDRGAPAPDEQFGYDEFNELVARFDELVEQSNRAYEHAESEHAAVDAPSSQQYQDDLRGIADLISALQLSLEQESLARESGLVDLEDSLATESETRLAEDRLLRHPARALRKIGGTYRDSANAIDFYSGPFYNDVFYTPVPKFDDPRPQDVVVQGAVGRGSFEQLFATCLERLGEAESALASLGRQTALARLKGHANDAGISSIERDVSSIERDVSSIESDVSSIESDVSSLSETVHAPARVLVRIGDTYRDADNPVDFYSESFYSGLFYKPVNHYDESTPSDIVIDGDPAADPFDALIARVINNQESFDTRTKVVESTAAVARQRAMSASRAAATERAENAIQSLSAAFTFEYMAEILRFFGGSGIVGCRHYTASGFHSQTRRVHDAPYGALNVHNHPNYQSMSGISEQALIVNGYYLRARHLDFKYYKPIQGPNDEINVEFVEPPPVPDYVLAKPTGLDVNTGAVDKEGDTQARWMSRVFEDNPEECKVYLAGMQVWLERADGGLSDNVDSFRHENIFDSALEEFVEGTYLTHSGTKDRKENINWQLNTIAAVDENGDPILIRIAYGMTTQYMGTMAPRTQDHVIAPLISIGSNQHDHSLNAQMTDVQAQQLVAGDIDEVILTSGDGVHSHQYRITWDGNAFVGVDLNESHQHEVLIETGYDGRIPYDYAKAAAGVIDDTNRFQLIHDYQTVDRLGGVPENDGSRLLRFRCADIERMCERVCGLDGIGSSIMETYDQYGVVDILQDRDGGQLNAAFYSRRYRALNNDASGRVVADRGFNDPNLFVAMTRNPNVLSGRTWFIPMELIVMTPLNSWNPYDLPTSDGKTIPAGAGTESNPFQTRSPRKSYAGIPFEFWSSAAPGDPADTENNMWILDANGVPRQVWAQGMRVVLPTGERTRIPVYAQFFDASYGEIQSTNMIRKLKTILKTMVRSQFYGDVTEADIEEL